MLRLFQRRPSPQTAHVDISHGADVYRIALKRLASSRRFTLRVRVATRDVVLTMPERSSLQSAREFAERHAAWIGVRLARLPKPVTFEPRSIAPLRGVDHRIVHCPGARGVVWVDADEKGPTLCVSGERAHVARRVADFLKKQARKDIERAVARHTRTLGLAARSVTLRDTTSRWGSCSSTGGLNFSWRLILAPPYVLDYLAAHEVAHFVHMNHSPAFWRVARRLFPETDKAEAWLKTHGANLHRYGAKAG